MGTIGAVKFSLITAALLLAGCSKGYLRHDRYSPAEIAPDDAIAIILAQPPADAAARTQEEELAECARWGLKGSRWAGRIVAPDEFRRLALTDRGQQAPSNTAAWEEFARAPSFQERISGARLRYLILVSGSYSKSPNRWTVGGGKGGMAVVADWEVSSSMHADILDLRNARHTGTAGASARGNSVGGVALLVVIPIPFGKPSFPEGVACRKLGEGVAEVFWGGKSSRAGN